MPLSGKAWAIGAVILAGVVIAGSYSFRQPGESNAEPAQSEALPPDISQRDPGRVKTRPRIRNSLSRPGRETSGSVEVTSGVKTLALQTPTALPQLSGYVLDHFDDWTTVPAGYYSDGIVPSSSGITLSGDPASTDSRMGILVSPPLPLHAPAMAAPAESNEPLPQGTRLIIEISLCQDGKEWSPWAMLERYQPPDGNRVAPPLQMRLSTAQIADRDAQSSTTISPVPVPAIRYRLTLSASGSAAPSVADVRIWKREYQ